MENERSILITGANGGIGSATARLLQAHGFRLILAGRNEGALHRLGSELASPVINTDVTSETSVIAMFNSIGPIHGIVHAVGSMLLKPAHSTSLDEFRYTVEVNLISAFLMIKHGVRAMTGTGGAMVFFSTVATGIGLPNHEAISAAKAGIDGLVLSAAATYAAKGIRINAVAPSLTDTPLASRLTNNEASLKASIAMHPLGRIGTPSDIASAAAWLVDPAQGWVTGQIIRVDGGLSTLRTRQPAT